MRTLKSIMVLGLALSTFTATEAAKLTFKVTNPNEKVKVRLTFSQSGEQKEVAIDAAGNGNIEITGFTPQYVTMQYTRGRRTLYLDPNQDLTLSFDSDNMWRNTTFEGAGAAINTYLGSKELQSLGMPDMKMQEAALIHKGDSLYAANCQVLEAAKLPADFTTRYQHLSGKQRAPITRYARYENARGRPHTQRGQPVRSQLPSIGSRKTSSRFHYTGKNTFAILYVLLFLQIRFVSSSFWKG